MLETQFMIATRLHADWVYLDENDHAVPNPDYARKFCEYNTAETYLKMGVRSKGWTGMFKIEKVFTTK